jgi:hypothetical protein
MEIYNTSVSIRKNKKTKSEFTAFSYTFLVAIFLAYGFFSVWFTIDINNTRSFVGLWFPLFLYHGVIGGLFALFIFTYYDVVSHHEIGTADRAMFHYPKYIWDVWWWMATVFFMFAFTLTINIVYVSNVGLDFVPSYDSADITIRNKSIAYYMLNFIMTILSMIGFFITIPMFYVYINKIYKLKTVDSIRSQISESNLIKLTPRRNVHHHRIQ